MPRGPRLDYPGLLHHVMVRGIERRIIFQDKFDYRDFLERFATVVENTGIVIYAWSLMPNHVHLLIRSGRVPLGKMMKRLLTGYALNYNRRHKRVGPLFQGRYKSVVCEEEPYLLELVRYIHLNPLRAGIVNSLDELEQYRWCGYRILVGRQNLPWQETGEILERFGNKLGEARRKYVQYVQLGLNQGKRADLVGGGLIRSLGGFGRAMLVRGQGDQQVFDQRVLGSGDFVSQVLKKIEQQTPSSSRLSLTELVNRVGKYYGVKPEYIIHRKKKKGTAVIKSVVVNLAIDHLGVGSKIIGQQLGLSRSAICKLNQLGEATIRADEKVVGQILGNP